MTTILEEEAGQMRGFLAAGVFFCLFSLFPIAGRAADVPTNIGLSSTETTITVQWTGDSDADSYTIYWGTASGNLNQTASVEDPTTEYTITGLTPGTEYFVAVTSVDNSVESSRSVVESITTDADTEAPAAPAGFDITSISDITETSARFAWEENGESDLNGYRILYGRSAGAYSEEETVSEASTAATVSGLASSSRYYFTIIAFDSSGNESEEGSELIVDTLPDRLAPDPPAGISGALAGSSALRVTVAPGNAQMVDFEGNIIYYGTEPGAYAYQRDIGDAGEYTFSSLPEDSRTWYFAASAYDQSGNESPMTEEIMVEIEDVRAFLGDSEEFAGGCFIGSLNGERDAGAAGWLALLLASVCLLLMRLKSPGSFGALLLATCLALPAGADAQGKAGFHTVGVSAGYFSARDTLYEDFYGDDSFPVSVFYDRHISRLFSLELEAAYWRDSGRLLSVSGEPTGISSEIEVLPVAFSVKLHFPISNFISGYVGAGPDYWYVSEEADAAGVQDEVSEWVGGYHGKIGLLLYNMDRQFAGTGALIETGYSVVDRFGENDTELGGWITELGFFYQF
jgi:hypothetical protein